VAQVVEHLLFKYKVPSLNLSPTKKNGATETHSNSEQSQKYCSGKEGKHQKPLAYVSTHMKIQNKRIKEASLQ
jgi:hypothetical protein